MQPEQILLYFAQYIEKELGIVYAEHNYFQLQNRLEEIARLLGHANIQELYTKATSPLGLTGAFKQLLLDTATNNETSFFRDPKIFRAFECTILNEFAESPERFGKLRIWSAASSTGQEAVSTAILINEFNKKQKVQISFSITGTDISERVLARAKTGTYTQLEVQRGLATPLLIKYFTKDDKDCWTVKPEIARFTQFQKLNLMDPVPFSEPFHVILCRNVLIYQKVESKKEILKRLTEALAPGGYLILGSGESLIGLSDGYEQVSSEGAIIYRKGKDGLVSQRRAG